MFGRTASKRRGYANKDNINIMTTMMSSTSQTSVTEEDKAEKLRAAANANPKAAAVKVNEHAKKWFSN